MMQFIAAAIEFLEGAKARDLPVKLDWTAMGKKFGMTRQGAQDAYRKQYARSNLNTETGRSLQGKIGGKNK